MEPELEPQFVISAPASRDNKFGLSASAPAPQHCGENNGKNDNIKIKSTKFQYLERNIFSGTKSTVSLVGVEKTKS